MSIQTPCSYENEYPHQPPLSCVTLFYVSQSPVTLDSFNILAPRDSIPCDEDGIAYDNASHAVEM